MEMRTLLLRYLLLLAAMPLCHSVRADTWTIRADNWCPYNCEPADKDPGYMIEILQGAAKKHGHTLDYQLLPYSRALEQAQKGQFTGVVGMLANDRDGFLFSEKMGVDTNCFFVRKGSPLRYRSLSDLASFGRIGIVEGYGYPKDFVQWKAQNPDKVQAVAGDNTLGMQAKKLAAGRIAAFIENENIVRYSAKYVDELKNIDNAGCLQGREPLFIGFSTKNPKAKEIKAQVDAHVATIRKSGELRRLLDKYHVAPW